jgi:quercetin dioxygenase-like cupin family protein
MQIQKACQALPDGERMECSPPVEHIFMEGVYCRQITLPADSLVVGRIHRFEHISILSKGRVTVFTEHGTQEISAPASWVSPAGTKRVVLAHEESIWTTVHHNLENERDPDVLENKYTAEEYAELGLEVADLERIAA